LAPKEKRIQAMVDLEIFCPAAGWTLLNPEWTIVLGTPGQDNPISGIQVNNKSLWSTANKVYVVKSNKNLFSVSTAVGRSGGSVSPSAIYNGRKVGGNQNLPKDVGYDDSGNASASGHLGLDNCDLASGFVTISNQPTMSIKFTNLNGLPISLYDTHNWQNAQPIQTFMVNLAAGGATITTPTPELVSVSSNKRTYTSGGVRHIQRAVDAPHFWCFQYSGCVGRYQLAGGQSITPLNIDSASYASAVSEGTLSGRLGGRFRLEGDASTVQAQGGDYNTVVTANGTSTSIAGSNALIFAMTTPGLFDKKSGKSYEQLFGSDVVRSVIPAGGDYRILACRYSVPAAMWQPHRLWQAQFTNAGGQSSFYYSAHNFSSSFTDDSGFDLNLSTASQPNLPQFIRAYPSTNAVNMGVRMPDIPQGSLGGATAGLDALNSFLDFDNGPGDTRDGSYCNKPDEGNFSALNYAFSVGEKTYRNGYFYTSYEMEPDKTASNAYFTPNRLISSPVMFGSLVTSVFDVPSVAAVTGYSGGGRPWQTLLFRPHVQPTQAGPAAASFAGSVAPVSGSLATHPGAQNPPDHYLLDLFSMPVVEPYAISEPLSTAGKLNLNYQIVPFTYIRRATGVYAAMKGELMRAVSISDNGNKNNPLTTAYTYKNAITAASGQTMPVFPPVYFWTETGSTVATQQPAANNHYWHRRIDPAETTKQLDERFLMNTSSIYPDRRKGLLRSASQICEIHMIPANPPSVPTGMYTMPGPSTALNREDNMKKFWSVHALTGDNSREEIYSHLYPKFTTRSNTFRVHVRAQALKKSRTTSVSSFSTADGDKVLSEYRGSYLLERYIDPNDATNLLPNYGAGGDPTAALSLESYYRFHILEVKRFAP